MRFIVDVPDDPEFDATPDELREAFLQVLSGPLTGPNGDTMYLGSLTVTYEDVAGSVKPRRSFAVWLRSQEKRDDLVGDLARDVKGDQRAPSGRATKAAWREYLGQYGGHVRDAFDTAWREFEQA